VAASWRLCQVLADEEIIPPAWTEGGRENGPDPEAIGLTDRRSRPSRGHPIDFTRIRLARAVRTRPTGKSAWPPAPWSPYTFGAYATASCYWSRQGKLIRSTRVLSLPREQC